MTPAHAPEGHDRTAETDTCPECELPAAMHGPRKTGPVIDQATRLLAVRNAYPGLRTLVEWDSLPVDIRRQWREEAIALHRSGLLAGDEPVADPDMARIVTEMATGLAEIAEFVGLPRDTDEPEVIVNRVRTALDAAPQLHDGRRARQILTEALNLHAGEGQALSMAELAFRIAGEWRRSIDSWARRCAQLNDAAADAPDRDISQRHGDDVSNRNDATPARTPEGPDKTAPAALPDGTVEAPALTRLLRRVGAAGPEQRAFVPAKPPSPAAAVWIDRRNALAEVLRSHQHDDSRVGDLCHCGGVMGDIDEHQATAVVEAGWAPAETPQLHGGRLARQVLADALNLDAEQGQALTMTELARRVVTEWRRSRDAWGQRLSDVQGEMAEHRDAWDRQREELRAQLHTETEHRTVAETNWHALESEMAELYRAARLPNDLQIEDAVQQLAGLRAYFGHDHPGCRICRGTGLTCEDHPGLIWDGTIGPADGLWAQACHCGAAGAPCPRCYPGHWITPTEPATFPATPTGPSTKGRSDGPQ